MNPARRQSTIVLIGGAPRCGKTSIANLLGGRHGFPWISTDAIECMLHRFGEQLGAGSELRTLFAEHKLREHADSLGIDMYDEYSIREIADAFLAQARSTDASVLEFVSYSARQGWDYIIEGYHLTPRLISNLANTETELRSAVIVSTDADEIMQRCCESNVKTDWLRDQKFSAETFEKICDMIALLSADLLDQAESLGVPTFDLANGTESEFAKVIAHLSG